MALNFFCRWSHALSIPHILPSPIGSRLRGLSLLGLHVVVGKVGAETTDQDDGVDGDATGGLVGLGVRG